MKSIINISILVLSFSLNAQVAIGKESVSGSGILDFGTGLNKGIILPAVTTMPGTPTNGTFVLDKNDKKIKMLQNEIWVELSKSGNTNTLVSNSGTETGRGVIIGAGSSTASGVLILESATQALILPKIANPEINVKSPYPGMMCYDTVNKSMAIFDGTAWNYWK